MKQTLQLKLGQRLTMTPQLQQAIRLLQLSSIELQQEIQTVLDSNLMIENGEAEGGEEADGEYTETPTDSLAAPEAPAESLEEGGGDDFDAAWEDPWSQGDEGSGGSSVACRCS